MRLKNIIYLILIALVLTQTSALAKVTEEGLGLAYGIDHAYFLKAPPGWLLDTTSGAGQGIYAVFYPIGSSWNGPAVMYSNAAAREGRSPEAAVEQDVRAIREKSPMLKVVDGGRLRTKDNKDSLVRYFSGDPFGNYEAVAYVVEKNVVANIVLTTRNKTAYEAALPAFRKLVGSYRFVSDDPAKLDLKAAQENEELTMRDLLPRKKD